jgi:uncharacterized protein (TIGR02646 family)
MHSVERSPEPDFFEELRVAYNQWDELDGGDRNRIRDALVRDFGTICAYCEQSCQSPTRYEYPNEESIDHFRPRSPNRFPGQWLDWLNLVYACRKCNQAKGDSWPGFGDTLVNQMLTAEDSRYVPVSEYVNPSAIKAQHPAEDFFAFDAETGEMLPSSQLNGTEWSMARRTIRDVDLNDSGLGANDEAHLWNLRLRQRALLIERINGLADFDAKVNIMLEFMLPDKPFSSFISAYINGRFPLIEQVFGQ